MEGPRTTAPARLREPRSCNKAVANRPAGGPRLWGTAGSKLREQFDFLAIFALSLSTEITSCPISDGLKGQAARSAYGDNARAGVKKGRLQTIRFYRIFSICGSRAILGHA